MLLLLTIAFISTSAFFVAAKRNGKHPGKAASLPFIALGLLLIVDWFVSPILASVLEFAVASDGIRSLITIGYNVFLVFIYVAFIRLNWTALIQTSTDR